MSDIRRRDLITLLGGAAAAWPLAARAQQATGQPLVGLLSPLSATAWVHILGAFRRGMRDLGYVEGANVAFAFRFADGQVAWTKSLRAPAPAICRSSGRRSSSWWSTSRPRSRWD